MKKQNKAVPEQPRTYDVHFNSDESSNNKGFKATEQYCRDYIEMHNGTDESYFENYKGGTVSIVCNETEETIFETSIPEQLYDIEVTTNDAQPSRPKDLCGLTYSDAVTQLNLLEQDGWPYQRMLETELRVVQPDNTYLSYSIVEHKTQQPDELLPDNTPQGNTYKKTYYVELDEKIENKYSGKVTNRYNIVRGNVIVATVWGTDEFRNKPTSANPTEDANKIADVLNAYPTLEAKAQQLQWDVDGLKQMSKDLSDTCVKWEGMFWDKVKAKTEAEAKAQQLEQRVKELEQALDIMIDKFTGNGDRGMSQNEVLTMAKQVLNAKS